MRKREKRRLAALSNAGRRVKLDLFAEPSGDLGGSHEEAEGGLDSEHHAGLPNSPSSSDCRVAVVLGTFNGQITSCPATMNILNDSLPTCYALLWQHQSKLEVSTGSFFVIGQQPENPLTLLGQYSDDELDEEANQHTDHTSADNSSADHNDQGKETIGQEYEDMEVNAGEDLTAQPVKQHDFERNSASPEVSENLEGNDDCRPSDAGVSCEDMDSTKQMSVTGSSDVQVVGDVGPVWKIVMHEASDKYYYWNIETGETSWEVPDVLAVETGLTNEQKTSPLDGDLDGSSTIIYTDGPKGVKDAPQIVKLSERCKNELLEVTNSDPDASSNDLKSSSHAGYMLSQETPSFGNYMVSQQANDGFLGNETSNRTGLECVNNVTSEDKAAGTDLSCSSLVKYGEYLLERLKSLKRFMGQLQGQEWISKYILELEIRLSDFRSLFLYGSSLLPFWVHSERQLRMLEDVINEKICQLTDSAEIIDVEAIISPSMGDEYEADGNEKNVVSAISKEISAAPPIVNTVALSQQGSRDEAPCDAICAEHSSLISHETIYAVSAAEGKSEEVNRASLHNELAPKPQPDGGEDVDMDVDMEVDEELPASNASVEDALGAKDFVPSQHLVQPCPPANFSSFASEDGFGVPPLPDEEWIPPPPPDNEPVPPPPPDEPPEVSYPPPPSYPEVVQSLSYIDQYNLSRPSSNFEYYGLPVTEVPSSNFYEHAEESQVAVIHPPLYYEAASNTYLNTAPLIVDPVESVIYGNLQHEHHLPVVRGVGSSDFHTEPGPESYGTIASDQNGFVGVPMEAGGGSLPVKSDFASIGGTEVASSVQAPAMISLKESVPVASSDVINSALAPAATSVVTKVHSKALRSKKRTITVASTLRSNKKVSSLVNKWKAAKEEMHEDDEDEPEDALEALEKKKQREIEQWRAQQIASGEAQDNANFQPLGSDWRERVKRRRAQLAREAKHTPPATLADEHQQPDLIELSRDLPSGWQAYYDETLKKVYYGNAVTSETTWTRPTK